MPRRGSSAIDEVEGLPRGGNPRAKIFTVYEKKGQRALTIVNAYSEIMECDFMLEGQRLQVNGVGLLVLVFEFGACVEAYGDGNARLSIEGENKELVELVEGGEQLGSPKLAW